MGGLVGLLKAQVTCEKEKRTQMEAQLPVKGGHTEATPWAARSEGREDQADADFPTPDVDMDDGSYREVHRTEVSSMHV